MTRARYSLLSYGSGPSSTTTAIAADTALSTVFAATSIAGSGGNGGRIRGTGFARRTGFTYLRN